MYGQRSSDSAFAQRAIVLQVLRDDRPERWTRAELDREISDLDPQEVTDGLTALEAAGVVVLDGESIRAARCARRLDALGLICI